MAHPKEPGHFNDDYKDGAYRGRVTRYRKLFRSPSDKVWYCDGTVDYLASANAVSRIAESCPNSLFIAAVRPHPELIFSLHQQECVSGNETIYDFEEAFSASRDRRARRRLPITRPEIRKIDYEERARMGVQLMRALESIPRERLLLIDFEMLKQDSRFVWHEICRFLNVDAIPVELSVSNPRKKIHSPFVTILRKYLRTLKRFIGVRNNYGMSKVVKAIAVSVDQERPIIPSELAQQLRDKYHWDKSLIKQIAQNGPSVIAQDGWLANDS